MDISDRALALVVEHREWEGSKAEVSVGAVTLAQLVAEDVPAIGQFVQFIGGWRNVERMIAGTMLPCQSWGEELGRLTDGKLTSALFLKRWDGMLPEAKAPPIVSGLDIEDGDDPRVTPAPDNPARPNDVAVEPLVVMRGRIGEVPSGPLFTHIVDPVHPGTFVVTGLGLAMAFDENTGFAFRNALAAGMLDIAASKPAVANAFSAV